MKNRIVKVLLVVLILTEAKLLFFPTKSTKASPQEVFGACVARVPQEWGEFVGGSEQSGVTFRNRQGTLRFVTTFPCNGTIPSVALEVRRTPAN
jgi:hypothetical protein